MRLIYLILITFLVSASCYAQTVPSTMEEKLQRTREIVTQGSQNAETTKLEEFNGKSSAVSVLQSLALLIGIVFIGAWSYKKYILKDTAVTNRTLKILERIPVAHRSSLLLTEIEGRKILVGLTPDSIALLELGGAPKNFAVELQKEILK